MCAIELPLPEDGKTAPTVSWRAAVEGKPVNLLAADGRLFVVTLDGHIHCFGPGKVETKVHDLPTAPAVPDAGSEFARAAIDATKVRDGYCVVWGVGSGRLVSELLRTTDLRVIAVEPDAEKVATAGWPALATPETQAAELIPELRALAAMFQTKGN